MYTGLSLMIGGVAVKMQELKDKMTFDAEKRKWHVRDVGLAIVIFVMGEVLIFAVLRQIPFMHVYLADAISILLASLGAICLLNQKYPLHLFSSFNIELMLKYSMAAFVGCFLIYAPFYHNIWTGGLEDIPKQYKILSEFSLIEGSFYLLKLCLLGPSTEEIFMRGFVYRILRNRYNIFWGTIVSTTIFYLFHGGEPNVKIILVSLVFTYVYEKSGTIWSSIIAHSLNNTLWVILIYLGVKYHS